MNSLKQEYLLHRSCPLCAGDMPSLVTQYSDLQFYTDSGSESEKRVTVSTVQCRLCGCLYMDPAYSPAGFEVLFEEAGMSYGAAPGRDVEQVHWLHSRGLLARNFKVMDVGCYDGRFLRSIPFEVGRIGVDADRGALERAARLDPEGHYVNSFFEQLDSEDFGQLDLITLIHVIEHVIDPKAVLATLWKLCSSSTRLVLETPIIERAADFANDINGHFSVQHLTHFSRSSLERLIRDSRFEIIEWFDHPEYNGSRLVLSAKEGGKSSPNNKQHRGEFLRESIHLFRYLSSWHEATEQALAALHEGIDDAQNLVVWGAGMHTEILSYRAGAFWSGKGIRLVDGDPLKIGKSWRGILIEPQSIVSEIDWDSTKLIISSFASTESISAHAIRMGVPERQIVRLYTGISHY